jgi:N-methylhydantoinase A
MFEPSRYRIGIDVGGTFTDLLAYDEVSGTLHRCKVPSTPRAPEEGVIDALQAALSAIGATPIALVSHSSTIATNALLGQTHLDLPRLALLTTRGFRDVLEIGRQGRAEVYNLFVQRPRPLVARRDRFAVTERLDAAGCVVTPLAEDEVHAVAHELRAREIRHCAVVFLHAYRNPAHEQRARDLLGAAYPELEVTLSSDVDPEHREYERTSTTAVNALLAPIVRGYLRRLAGRVHAVTGQEPPIYVMQSNGGMVTIADAAERPAQLIESGPASGVIAAAMIGHRLGIRNLLSFDMGGTTAKAGTVFEGTPEIVTEFEAAGRTHSGRAVRGSGYPVRFPFIDLAEVSAGGGTIAWIDSAGALRAGPESAGADPGPVCYDRGGARSTVTDANLMLGRLNPTELAGGAVKLHPELATQALAALAGQLPGMDAPAVAAGILRIVNAEMAKVLRIVSLERGHDPRQFTLVAFGGAGPLHAAELAEELAIPRIIIPPLPGLLSAWGLLVAGLTYTAVTSLLQDAVTVDVAALEARFQAMAASLAPSLQPNDPGPSGPVYGTGPSLPTPFSHAGGGETSMTRHLDMRYAGQSFDLTIPVAAPTDRAALAEAVAQFHRQHERVYGYALPDSPVELVAARLTSATPAPEMHPRLVGQEGQAPGPARPGYGTGTVGQRQVYFPGAGAWRATPIYRREALAAGHHLSGPAIVEQYDTATVIPPGWEAVVDDGGNLLLTRQVS